MKLLIFILACLISVGLQAELFFSPQSIAKHLEVYTEKEIRLIEKDLGIVRSICLDDTTNTETRFYVATAGAPGARKTTILEKFVAIHPEYAGGVYIDPDSRSLKFMAHTYYALSLNPFVISQTKDYGEVIKNAYEKWRGGSNYIALTLFEEAAAAGRSIIHGTTSTGTHVPNLFAKLKEHDYQIVLLLCSCSDTFRQDAVSYRNQNIRFYQSSVEDTLTKGKLFPQRMGAYFAYADLIYFYWNDELFSSERLAAVWRNGKLEVYDSEAMKRFADKYEEDRKTLASEGQNLPPFKSYLSEL